MSYIIVATILGAGIITGLLFAFSNFVMSGLAQVSNKSGMAAMQRINETIINPLFMLLFMGTTVLSAIIAIRAVLDMSAARSMPLLAGALCYLIGPFGITLLFNVPLNNRLADADVADADVVWKDYQIRWQRWNHLRTFIGALSIVFLAIGLAMSGL